MKPILFSTPMVQAIQSGGKTQTRRVVQPQNFLTSDTGYVFDTADQVLRDLTNGAWVANRDGRTPFLPRYTPGDILWVRETWRAVDFQHIDGTWSASVDFKAGGIPNPRAFWQDGESSIYERTGWRPSIHMPREAARIFLRVTDVRGERLQDISVEDCVAEGLDCDNDINNPDPATHEGIRNWNLLYAQFLYKELWDSLNAKRGYGWDTNPWVWVYTFDHISKEEAENA